jgi:hypothetical protein
MATAGTIASRAYAPKPGAAARPAIVRKACQQLAGGKNTGETLLTQNRKHYPFDGFVRPFPEFFIYDPSVFSFISLLRLAYFPYIHDILDQAH